MGSLRGGRVEGPLPILARPRRHDPGIVPVVSPDVHMLLLLLVSGPAQGNIKNKVAITTTLFDTAINSNCGADTFDASR